MKIVWFSLFLLLGFVSALPTNFDARQKWTQCAFFILNQEQCGSCWDFSSVESFADRLCITGEAKSGTIISPETILDCSRDGCDGGNPKTAWNYLIQSGSTTCTSTCFSGCQPYDSGAGTSPSCHQGTCDSGAKWPVTYFGKSYEALSGITNYQNELYNNGPLQACFTVYNNFYTFFNLHPTGIYTAASGSEVGGHCVKMMGWGTESGQDYWLFANSWDDTWGDQGYFKMARGTNLCGIESSVSEGFTPKQTTVIEKLGGVQLANTTDFIGGGWTVQTDLSSNDLVLRAATSAIQLVNQKLHQQYRVTEIVSAETQVVSGINFRMILNAGSTKLSVKVHRDLQFSYSLSEVQIL